MTTTHRAIIVPNTRTGIYRYHTIHVNDKVFTVQKNGTSVLAFRNKADAVQFGKILESHYDITHEWPIVEFEQTILYKYSSRENRLKYVSTKHWHEDELRDFCVKNCMGLLDIYNFENDRRLVGRSVTWEAPMHYYVDMLNSRLE